MMRTEPPRVLVVEDSFLTAQALAAMVRDLGYAVAGPVADLSGAARILDTEHVDLALLDVNLRGELVTPVADRLAQLGRPFLFLTAYAGLDALPDPYQDILSLPKPCTPEQLGEAIRTLL